MHIGVYNSMSESYIDKILLYKISENTSKLGENKGHLADAIYDTEKNEVTIKAGSQCLKWGEIKDSSSVFRNIIESRQKAKSHVDNNGKFIKDYKLPPASNNGTNLTEAIRLILGTSSGPEQWKYINECGTEGTESLMEYLAGKHIVTADKRNRQFIPKSERVVHSASADTFSQTNKNKDDNNVLAPYLGKNTIFYGVPGCGKSYKVKELLGADGAGSKVPEAQCKRVLFHPEYSYSDFVGQVMPQTEGERIEYKFAPGPFVEILKDAYDHPRKEYFLIIEEINRGNAPAIFGDLFQLLDRRPQKSGEEEGAKPGESEYGIYNRDILGVLNEGREEPLKEVKIPANLTLFATMNTCDQNVFTLDTAFKRRWRMQRIKNMFYADKEPFVCVIGQSGGKIGERGIIWKEFAEAVNKDILLNCNDGTAAEDKLLGAYFVNEEEIADAQVFAEKVLMYLREDVARYDKSQLFDAKYPTLDAVIDGFVRGENVFSPACGNIKALYDRVPDTATPSEEE